MKRIFRLFLFAIIFSPDICANKFTSRVVHAIQKGQLSRRVLPATASLLNEFRLGALDMLRVVSQETVGADLSDVSPIQKALGFYDMDSEKVQYSHALPEREPWERVDDRR